jgi:hypothetical protein
MDPGDCEIEVGRYDGPLEGLLAAIERAGCFEGATLELVGGHDDEVWELLAALTRGHAGLAERNRRARDDGFRLGPVWIATGPPTAVPIDGDVLARLRSYLDDHADPELALELGIFDADGYLLWAPDVGYGIVWVDERVPAQSLARLRSTLREFGRLGDVADG